MSDRRTEFLEDLEELLTRHRVYFTSEDHYQGYADCGQEIRITAEFDWECGDEEITEDIVFEQNIDVEDILHILGRKK